jgi:predicted metal-dependent phosphoesterase TrpH
MLAGGYGQPVLGSRRVDLHVHAKISKAFPFDFSYMWKTILQAKRVGLDGLAVTEHFHATRFWDTFTELSKRFEYRDGVYILEDGFRILTGAELSVSEGCDLLVYGTIEQLRALDGSLPRPVTEGTKPAFADALRAIRHTDTVVVGAHLLRPKKELAKLGEPNLLALDALELNGKDFFKDHDVRVRAKELGRPIVGGSDAHFWAQVGIKCTVVPTEEITQQSVASAIRQHRTRVRFLSYGPLAVRLAQTYKRVAKAHHARTGSLSVLGVGRSPRGNSRDLVA